MGRQVLRRGARLSVEISPDLLTQLRQRAVAEDRPVAALVRRWIEAGLQGVLDAERTDLTERVTALEAAVAALQASADDTTTGGIRGATAGSAWFRLGSSSSPGAGAGC
jgi:hypothetical protein